MAACAGGAAGAYVGLQGIRAGRRDAASLLNLIKDVTQPGLLDLAGLTALASQLHAAVSTAASTNAKQKEEAEVEALAARL